MKKSNKKSSAPKLNIPIMVEIEDLTKFSNITITAVGEENMYFAKDGKNYFCKCL